MFGRYPIIPLENTVLQDVKPRKSVRKPRKTQNLNKNKDNITT